MYWRRHGHSYVRRKKMKIAKPVKNLKNRRLKKMPFTARGYQIYYGVIILIVLIIGFSGIFS